MRVDTIFTNARIRTLDADRPAAHSIGVLGGRIVGFDDDLHGVRKKRAQDLAVFAIASIEGALVMARARRDPAPLDTVHSQLRALLRAERSPA